VGYGPKDIRFTVTFTPRGFERFFQDIERRRLLAADVAELRAIAADVGMDILGPPLSDKEVRQIIAQAEKCDQFVPVRTLPLLDSERTARGKVEEDL
jgi:hypothetical protein